MKMKARPDKYYRLRRLKYSFWKYFPFAFFCKKAKDPFKNPL